MSGLACYLLGVATPLVICLLLFVGLIVQDLAQARWHPHRHDDQP